MLADDFLFLVADRDFYEPLGRYGADRRDFADLVRRILPPCWRLARRNLWFDCDPAVAALPAQGWKIHVSATLGNSAPVLATTARLLAERRVPFKFVADKTLLFLVNGKRWNRGGAGKFITVYPADDGQCRDLLACLDDALTGYSGPYILSDRRYRDGSPVHYRYGGFRPLKRLAVDGRPVHVIAAPGDTWVDDDRTPYFHLPPGLADPFAAPEPVDREAASDGPAALKDGRYRIESALAFSNSGGVYLGVDTASGERVVIKEARPFTNVSPRGTDAVWLLKKEHRLLTLLADTRVAPRPVDFFRDWEHFYLVEELIEGKILRSYHAEISLSLRTRPSREQGEEFFARYRRLYSAIARALAVLHERRIVFSDLSHYNVIVAADGETVRLIDLEGAHEEGVDLPTMLFTPGFAATRRLDDGGVTAEDDLFSLGGLMLAGLIPVNSTLLFENGAHRRFLAAMERDLGLPPALSRCIGELLDADRARRPALSHVLQVLRDEPAPLADVSLAASPEAAGAADAADAAEAPAEDEELGRLIAGMLRYLSAHTSFERDDRLFPADPAIFDTNPLQVAYGACGVALALQRITGSVPPAVIDWILRRDIGPAFYPPGLYAGLAGVAWTLLELGLRERAEEVLAMTHGHPLLERSPDLFHGAAGWGMTQLRFFLATGDEAYLARAAGAGRFLVASRHEEGGTCWWTSEGDVACGLAHGASGIALFLLYLHLATGDGELLATGRKALRFVAARSLRNADGGITWRIKEGEPTFTPYWRSGSAGVGMVLLRYLRVAGEPEHAALLAGLLLDTERKYAIFPGRFFGLAGIGEFYLDLAASGRHRDEAAAGARKALAGLLLFRLERDDGIAFPGESRARISCDFGTGSAGIALFLHRLRSGGPPAYMLDELLG